VKRAVEASSSFRITIGGICDLFAILVRFSAFVRELILAGTVVPSVDWCQSLGEVPQAMRLLATGYARGRVAVTLELNTKP
jgi:hypothetical protein